MQPSWATYFISQINNALSHEQIFNILTSRKTVENKPMFVLDPDPNGPAEDKYFVANQSYADQTDSIAPPNTLRSWSNQLWVRRTNCTQMKAQVHCPLIGPRMRPVSERAQRLA